MSNRQTKNTRLIALIPLTLMASAISNALHAEEQDKGLNVVTVTAQKRPQSAQETPISLNVLSAEQLIEGGIEKIDDLQYKVPNLQMSETGISTQMYIRGIGTGNNQGFEQSVGQYIDGVYYGRQQLIRAPFLDLERVEVLKGPQSILFGKNSIAGALNMISAKPTDDLEVKLDFQYVPEFGATEITAVVSGGITDTLSARLAVRDYQEDGFVRNTFRDRDEVDREEQAIRASFRWVPTDEVDITLKIEKADFFGNGRQIEIIQDDPFASPIAPSFNFDDTLAVLGHPDGIIESDLNFERQADDEEFSDNELTNITLTADFEVGEYTLTTTSGLVSYEFSELCDCDFIAAPVFDAFINEEYEQFSQEIRITSPISDTFDWVGGLFYQTSDLDFDDAIRIPTDSILGLIAGGALAPLRGQAAARRYESDSDLWAAFFQGRWYLNENWILTVGARYTSEEKTGFREINIIDMATNAITTSPAAPALFDAVFAIQNEQSPFSPDGHSLKGSNDEGSFTPQINLQYQANENVMIYGSAVTGFKAGGFDARANNTASFEFKEEEATSFELGLKSTLLDNTLEANIAFYRTDYDNLQVSQFDGVLGFNVGNAKKTVVQGVEVDGRWMISDELTMSYAFAVLDHEFKDFENGNCYAFQSITDPGSFDAATGLCNYTGKSGQYTPEFTASLGLDWAKPVDLGIFDYFRATVGLYHSAEQNVDVNLNPLYDIDAYTKLDARISLEGENWTVALFGKNITDEQILTYVGNVPLSAGSFGTNTFYGFVDRPASYGVQLSYQY